MIAWRRSISLLPASTGDYAWLKRMDAEEEPLFIARALLPEEIDEGTKLKYEMLQYEII